MLFVRYKFWLIEHNNTTLSVHFSNLSLVCVWHLSMTQQNGAVLNLRTTNCSVAPSVVWNPHFVLVHLIISREWKLQNCYNVALIFLTWTRFQNDQFYDRSFWDWHQFLKLSSMFIRGQDVTTVTDLCKKLRSFKYFTLQWTYRTQSDGLRSLKALNHWRI